MTGLPPHGTYARRKTHDCLCTPCRDAATAYNRNRARRMAYGTWEPFVDAEPVRAHVQALVARGLGWYDVAQLAGVVPSTVSKLLHGQPNQGIAPTRRMRRDNAERLLAVAYAPDAATDRRIVDGTGARRRLQALMARGWPGTHLAPRLGRFGTNVWRTLHGQHVFLGTHRAVCALYDKLWDEDPAAHGVSARAVSRARNHAARNGWPPPMAWDDDTIDDPSAGPADPGPEDRTAAIVEDFDELIASGCTREQAARRLGIAERTIDRHRAAARSALQEAS